MADAAEDAPLSLDQAWAELRLYLQRSKGLCLVFLYSDSSAQLLEIKS